MSVLYSLLSGLSPLQVPVFVLIHARASDAEFVLIFVEPGT